MLKIPAVRTNVFLQNAGFTLLEIMISLGLGLFLLSGVYEIFNSIRQSSRYVNGLAMIQENGQLASYLLSREISQTGYTGCRKIDEHFPVNVHISADVGSSLIIQGYNQQNLPGEARNIAKKMVAGSSVLAIQFMRSQTANLVNDIKVPSSFIQIDNSALFHVNDRVLVADCFHADLVSLIAVNQNNSLQSNVNLQNYFAGSQVGLWENEWFYVGKTGRFDRRGQAVTALYVYQPKGRDEELVDFVSTMHIQYGLLNRLQQLVFLPATQITDWNAVKSVRLVFLLNSGGAVLSQRQQVQFDGQTWLAADNKLYREWELITSLPNR